MQRISQEEASSASVDLMDAKSVLLVDLLGAWLGLGLGL